MRDIVKHPPTVWKIVQNSYLKTEHLLVCDCNCHTPHTRSPDAVPLLSSTPRSSYTPRGWWLNTHTHTHTNRCWAHFNPSSLLTNTTPPPSTTKSVIGKPKNYTHTNTTLSSRRCTRRGNVENLLRFFRKTRHSSDIVEEATALLHQYHATNFLFSHNTETLARGLGSVKVKSIWLPPTKSNFRLIKSLDYRLFRADFTKNPLRRHKKASCKSLKHNFVPIFCVFHGNNWLQTSATHDHDRTALEHPASPMVNIFIIKKIIYK